VRCNSVGALGLFSLFGLGCVEAGGKGRHGADSAIAADTGSGVRHGDTALGSGDTGDPSPEDIVLSLSGPIVCAEPGNRDASPMVPWILGPGWDEIDDSEHLFTQYAGSGLAVGDVDDDGRLDLFLPRMNGSGLWMGQADGTWANEAATRLPSVMPERPVGAVMADVDGDGDLDVYVTALRAPNVLLINDGDGVFVDGTDAAAVGGGDWDSISAAFGDWDGDGDLDLAVANHREDGPDLLEAMVSGNMTDAAHPNLVYQNDGEGGFSELELPDNFRDGFGFLLSWLDLDGDGDLDLYAVNDFGAQWIPNQVLINDGGALLSVDWPEIEVAIHGMGLGVGDLNRDGSLDLLMSSWGHLSLLESDGVGAWFDGGAARDLLLRDEGRQVGWGAALEDIDNDGDLDAMMVFGRLVVPEWVDVAIADSTGLANAVEQPDALWLQGDDGAFSEVAGAWGLDHLGVGRGLLLVDLNGDGWLDLLRRDLNGQPLVHRAQCGEAAWLTVELRDAGANPFAIGAQVEIESEGLVWTRTVMAGGSGFATAGPPIVHIGLGERDHVDRIEVRWPDGHRSSVEGVDTRQRVRIERLSSPAPGVEGSLSAGGP
jgi:hypothetical protein